MITFVDNASAPQRVRTLHVRLASFFPKNQSMVLNVRLASIFKKNQTERNADSRVVGYRAAPPSGRSAVRTFDTLHKFNRQENPTYEEDFGNIVLRGLFVSCRSCFSNTRWR